MEEGAKGGLDFINDATNIGANDRVNLYYYSVDGNTWSASTNLVPFTFVKGAAAEEEVVETPKAEEVVETPAAEETVETPKAPQPFDFAVFAAIAALVSCAGYALCRKH